MPRAWHVRVHMHRLPFVLEASDFPLQLTVRELRASLRGAEARREAGDDAAARVAAYVTFYTEEIDEAARYLLWVGVPVGWLLLTCCGCCLLCLCCICVAPEPTTRRLNEHELADLAATFPEEFHRELKAVRSRTRVEEDDDDDIEHVR